MRNSSYSMCTWLMMTALHHVASGHVVHNMRITHHTTQLFSNLFFNSAKFTNQLHSVSHPL